MTEWWAWSDCACLNNEVADRLEVGPQVLSLCLTNEVGDRLEVWPQVLSLCLTN